MAESQSDPDFIPQIYAICAGVKDHVTLVVVITGELFHAVDGFDWVEFYRAAASGVLKLGPYQKGHGCLLIFFDEGGVWRGDPQLANLDC